RAADPVADPPDMVGPGTRPAWEQHRVEQKVLLPTLVDLLDVIHGVELPKFHKDADRAEEISGNMRIQPLRRLSVQGESSQVLRKSLRSLLIDTVSFAAQVERIHDVRVILRRNHVRGAAAFHPEGKPIRALEANQPYKRITVVLCTRYRRGFP